MVREGSRRFEGVEPLSNSVQVPYTSCYHCVDEVREGSVQSNHSELTSKTSTHLAFSALKWFEKVRGGSRGLNSAASSAALSPCLPVLLQLLAQFFLLVFLCFFRTFSNLIFTVGTSCVGYLYTITEWFNPLEPPRTFSNHFSAEKARCVEVFDVSSEWFDCTEPSRTSSTQW